MNVPLSERQRDILRRVVEEYVATGQPVGSRTLVEHGALPVSPATVRAELAELERLGLLMHPHTSAGRIPTEAGYRVYVDGLLAQQDARPGEFPLELGPARAEVEEALQATTEVLSQVTRLFALISAPPLEAAAVKHVEVLGLQPNVVMVVVITSTGGVSKQRYAFAEPVDPGVVMWAADYLTERLSGVKLGSRLLRQVFDDPSLSLRERTFLAVIRPTCPDPMTASSKSDHLALGRVCGWISIPSILILFESALGGRHRAFTSGPETRRKRAGPARCHMVLIEPMTRARDGYRPNAPASGPVVVRPRGFIGV